MTIKVGDKLPSVKLKYFDAEGMKEVASDALFAGKKGVLFGLPGAFTPTCSAKHVPSYVQNIDALKAKGVQVIACVSVNDVFVMSAWGKDQQAGDAVLMLADGNAEFTKAIGLDVDFSAYGMGTRSNRYAAIIEDGVVKTLNVEEPGAYEVSSAEAVLAAL